MTEWLQERFELAQNRMQAIAEELSASDEQQGITETTTQKAFVRYFAAQAKLLLQSAHVYQLLYGVEAAAQREQGKSLLELYRVQLKEWNEAFYQELRPGQYESSFTNPAYCTEIFGKGSQIGSLLAAVAADFRSTIAAAYEGKPERIVIRMELLLELYTSVWDSFLEYQKPPAYEVLQKIVYWYVSDYSEDESLARVREMVDPQLDFAYGIVVEEDLSDPDYLYLYGEYITENELQMAQFMASLPQETIHKMADTFTEGYRIGFVNTGKDLSRKQTVNIRYPLGFERMIREAIRNFELMGLRPVIYRAESNLFRRSGTAKIGFFGANPNKQYDYDHKEDEALFMDGQFVTRKLECLKEAFEAQKDLAAGHAGPAVVEIFGEHPFSPRSTPEAPRFDEHQQKLMLRYQGSAGAITNTYIKGEERSFTIIAFPVPEIGPEFPEIFEKTIQINTLDYKKYQTIQQCLIDALDTAEYVHVTGKGKNTTDLTIAMHGVKDASQETQYENCVADVNIPVGEVFTSPKLEGTKGTLFVSRVYLKELEYRNLEIQFTDGMVTSYSCDNFEDPKENQKYIKENVLYHYESLPMGEFAIGTNTQAYVMARKYGIEAKLPILIAEKTGPHFALGDTCYSHAEDIKVYNPDGKEIVARDNAVSILRKEDAEKAYFNCHTDVTIPYDELGKIEIIRRDGSTCLIWDEDRFVLPGTEALNEAFTEA